LTRAQPGPGGDVTRRVDVGVHTAMFGADHQVLPGSLAVRAAPVAISACVCWVHYHYLSASFFRFAGEDGRELCPAHVEDHFVQPGLGRRSVRQPCARTIWPGYRSACHGPGVELLRRNHVKFVHGHAGCLVAEVAAPAADLARLKRQEHHIESAQRLLLGGEGVPSLPVRVSRAYSSQLGRLGAVTDAGPVPAPRFASFFQGGVVQVTVVGQQTRGTPFLRASRVGAELVRSSHLHPARVVGVGHRLGRFRPVRPLAGRPYDLPVTFRAGHREGRERGFRRGKTAAVTAQC
jgi:hypothetical protein